MLRHLHHLLSTIVDALASVVIAPACAVCDTLLDRPTAGPVCDACWSAIRPLTPPLCSVCGDPLPPTRASGLSSPITESHDGSAIGELNPDPLVCRRCRGSRLIIARSRAIGEYSGTLRAAVHLLKYEKRRSMAPRLAAMMAVSGADVLHGADAAVPVPLHWTRKWRRGFNQASLLAGNLGVCVWPALVRVRATSPQVDLTADARRLNVRHAFAIARREWPWRRRWPARLKGQVVVLVDDVSTTGATLEACAEVLREAGAREVRALTAARVVVAASR